jgi:hypothetical protein
MVAGGIGIIKLTMRTTPETMRRMTPIRRREKRSSLSMKAKKRTKMREDDLTMASRFLQRLVRRKK